jgi:hypothetical protein
MVFEYVLVRVTADDLFQLFRLLSSSSGRCGARREWAAKKLGACLVQYRPTQVAPALHRSTSVN